jgi:hypothetical protein
VLSVAIAAYWRRHDPTVATRRLSRLLVLVFAALFVGRIGHSALGIPLEQVMTTDMFLIGLAAALPCQPAAADELRLREVNFLWDRL